ncbi:hypothetical protein [Pseudomonas sp. NA-150]|uniref:hypothetical protein n=1 Tax=Pseudomonas sp. NA-150 TaxID=3367525 RepID=UPI0037CC714E
MQLASGIPTSSLKHRKTADTNGLMTGCSRLCARIVEQKSVSLLKRVAIMSSVKRWFAHWYMDEMVESATGDYIQVIDYDAAMARETALQERLTTADQRIDDLETQMAELVSAVRSINYGRAHQIKAPGDDEPQYRQRKEWIDWVLGLCDEASASTEPTKDSDWHMNPCKLGHRDVGAAMGIAHCYQCDEKITAATTQEAFEQWNATHPAGAGPGKPSELGLTCNQIREERGLPICKPCITCNNGACIDK